MTKAQFKARATSSFLIFCALGVIALAIVATVIALRSPHFLFTLGGLVAILVLAVLLMETH